MGSLAAHEVKHFLERLGETYDTPATLYLIGGGALCILGNSRRTMDLDFTLPASDTPQSLLDTMKV